MPLRPSNGPLSTFDVSTTTLDGFKLKKPFANDVTDTDTLQTASDWNHMFDAVIRLQNELSTAGVGTTKTIKDQKIVNTDASTVISKAVLTDTVTTAISSKTGTVPAIFGTNPFQNPRFSISVTPKKVIGTASLSCYENGTNINAYLSPEQGGFTSWAVNNDVIMSTIVPTNYDLTGSGYSVKTLLLNYKNQVSWVDNFYRNGTGYAYSDVGIHTTIRHFGTGYTEVYNASTSSSVYPAGCCTVLGGILDNGNGDYQQTTTKPCVMVSSLPVDFYGSSFITIDSTAGGVDQQVTFRVHGVFQPDGSGQDDGACGVILRASGTSTTVTGYGLLFNGRRDTSYRRVRIVKFTNHDITASVLDHLVLPIGGSMVVVTTSPVSATYKVNGVNPPVNTTEANTSAEYRFSAIGTTLKLEESVNGGAWSTLMSGTDASIASGKAGFFSKGIRGNNNDMVMFLSDFSYQEVKTFSTSMEYEVLYTLTGTD